MLLLLSCRKESGTLGLGMAGDLLGTEFTDTITIEAHSLAEDTIATGMLSANLVGLLHDPVFGVTTASSYMQFALAGGAVDLGSGAVADSVVLTLQLSDCYGDTSSAVGIRAYRLADDMPSGTHFNQNSTLAYDPTPLNYELRGYDVRPHSRVIIDTGTYAPHLRIRLSQAFGQYLADNSPRMTGDDAFRSIFKGLCISAVSYSGSTGYILASNLNSALTGIVLYYHNDSQSGLKYTFHCLGSCRRFTRFEHDYGASADPCFVSQVIGHDPAAGRERLFVQATGGVKTKVTFPYLKDAFKADGCNVIVNKAELVVADMACDEAFLTAPPRIGLQGVTKSGKTARLPDDETFTNAEYFGGSYDKTRHEYRFRITRYVQDQLRQTGGLDNCVYLVARGASVRAGRLVAGGTDTDGNGRLRLELSYTLY